MSDLSASQCGCPEFGRKSQNNNWIWIILAAMLLCNCGNERRGGCCICDLFQGNSCETLMLMLVLLNCCGCKSLC